MKLSATHYDETVSVEVPRDDLTLAEFANLVRTLTLALGYDAGQVYEVLGEHTLGENDVYW